MHGSIICLAGQVRGEEPQRSLPAAAKYSSHLRRAGFYHAPPTPSWLPLAGMVHGLTPCAVPDAPSSAPPHTMHPMRPRCKRRHAGKACRTSAFAPTSPPCVFPEPPSCMPPTRAEKGEPAFASNFLLLSPPVRSSPASAGQVGSHMAATPDGGLEVIL